LRKLAFGPLAFDRLLDIFEPFITGGGIFMRPRLDRVARGIVTMSDLLEFTLPLGISLGVAPRSLTIRATDEEEEELEDVEEVVEPIEPIEQVDDFDEDDFDDDFDDDFEEESDDDDFNSDVSESDLEEGDDEGEMEFEDNE